MDNPFLKLLEQSRAQQGSMGGGMPQGAPMPSGEEGDPVAEMPNVGEKGVTGDSTKPLTQAIQAVHAYIADSTDRKTITIARSVISLLVRLIQEDQQSAARLDQQSQQQAPMIDEQSY